MGKNSQGCFFTASVSLEPEMSSFQNFFNEDFLLSSSLKPKNSIGSTEVVMNRSNAPNCETKEAFSGVSDENLNINQLSNNPHSKRVCLIPDAKIANNPPFNAAISASPSPSLPQGGTVTPPPHYLSDQILQIRIKLQIYQKEYAHFVECANRSSLQIQETLEELHKLVNWNCDIDSNKVKTSLNEVSIGNGTVANQTILTSVSVQTPSTAIVKTAATTTALSEITIKSVKHRPRAFPRKPRCLIFNSIQPSFSDTMVTSSLDGSVQIWSKSEQKIQSSIYLPSFLHKPFFVEDLCWDRHPNGLLALGMCESANAPVADDSNGSNSNRSDRQIAFLQFNPRDPASTPRFVYSNLAPHDRSISVIESWSSTKVSSDASYFLTGGLDKSIYSWKVASNGASRDPEISTFELHRRHTSSVQAICYDWVSSDIWSGGTDCRLVQWSGDENRLVNELRWDSRISHLIKSQTHPNLMLATVTSMSSQLRLLDCRINAIVHSFGTQETANLSRYVRPSWHLEGNLIANGTLSPADSVGSINIWDIRMMGSSGNGNNIKPIKMINCEDRRLVRAEFAPDGRSLVGMSTDGAMTFVEFSCS